MHLSLSAGGDSAKSIGGMLYDQAMRQLSSQGLHEEQRADRVATAISEYAEDTLEGLVGSASVSVSLSINIWKPEAAAEVKS